MLHSLVTEVTFTQWLLSHAASHSQAHRALEQSLHGRVLVLLRKGGANESCGFVSVMTFMGTDTAYFLRQEFLCLSQWEPLFIYFHFFPIVPILSVIL